MSLNGFWFLPATLAVGWFGTRAAIDIRHTHGKKGDILLMLALGWSPLLSWLLSTLVSLFEKNP